MPDPCIFCQIVRGEAPATIVRRWPGALAFVPLNPVVEGHTLVIPRRHTPDFAAYADDAAEAMFAASQLARDMGGPMNLITSKGREATQSVFHLHLHLVPRAENDGLALPWYSGKGNHSEARPGPNRCSTTPVFEREGREAFVAARRTDCPCAACDPGLVIDGRPTGLPSRMNVCPDCGNKRCPKAANHARWQCSGSNEPGQVGVPVEEPKRRLRACVEEWPEAETGAYNPACCRFPKSCSATIYDPERVTDADLEERR